jgi:hypothetical protein
MSNSACIGYAIMACKKLGMTNEELQQLESIMYGLMDLVSKEEAEEAYREN